MGITEDGKTAVFHLTLQEPTIVGPSGQTYKFVHRKGVSLAWIMEDDLLGVLQITERCCGNRAKHNFLLANQAQVDMWKNAVR